MNDFIQVHLDEIEVSDVKIREIQKDHPNYAGMKQNIAMRGVLQAILIRPSKSEDYKYEIVDGLQRVAISLELGLVAIPANLQDLDDDEAQFAQYACNIHRIPTSPKDKLHHLQRFMARHPETTQARIAEMFGASQGEISNIIQLKKLLPELLELVDDGTIKGYQATMLARHIHQDYQDVGDVLRWCKLDQTEFNNAILDRKTAIKELQKGKAPKVTGPRPYPLKAVEIICMHDQTQAELSSEEEGSEAHLLKATELMTLKRVLRLDPISIKAREDAKKSDSVKKAQDDISKYDKLAKKARERLSAEKAEIESLDVND